MQHLGLDLGTKTIVLARKDEDGRPIFRSEINGFYSFDRVDGFVKQMLIKQSIPYTERNGKFYALGRKAEDLAHAFNGILRRPMSDGTVSQEPEAINIMASIVHAIIGTIKDETILYYCVPADALNQKTNVGLHQKIAQLIIDNKQTEAKIRAFPINEARAIAIGSGEPTVIAISWGAGMVNVCYAKFGITIFQFSLVGSGDKIDIESARAFGFDPSKPYEKSAETPTTIARRKHEIDLTKPLNEMDRVDQTIALNCQLLIESVVQGIIDGFNNNSNTARFDGAIPIFMAGGTATPKGFGAYFSTILKDKNPPFEAASVKVIGEDEQGEVQRKQRTLFAVAEGCLEAALLHMDE